MNLTLSIVALAIALLSAIASAVAIVWARRSALAAERSAETADRERLRAATPRFELKAFFDSQNRYGGGPCIELRLLDQALDEVILELVSDASGSIRDPSIALSGSGGPVQLGPMGTNEAHQRQIPRNGKVDGVTIRLSVDCRRGSDRWQLPLSATFPERQRGPRIY